MHNGGMMKEMSVEELLDDLCFYADLSDEHYKIQAEILRRYEELEKENEGLRCCGNCGKHYKDCHNELSYEFCDKWQSDGLSREEREK